MRHRPANWIARHPLAARSIAVAALALAFTLLTGALDGGVGVAPRRFLEQPRFLVANTWPGLLAAAVLLAATRRALFSFALAFGLQGVVYAVNALKTASLGMPLLPADFRMAAQLRHGGAHVLGAYLPPFWWLAVALAVVALVALWRREPPLLPAGRGRRRLLAGGAAALVLASLLGASPGWRHVYNGRTLWMEPWSAAATSNHAGLVSSLLMFQLHFSHHAAKPDRSAAQALVAAVSPELNDAMQHVLAGTARGAELPDLIVVQSESFFDPRILRGYEASDFTPNFNRLAAHGSTGALHVPTFGGGTIRTEFEVLTGLSLRYFDNLQFPYLQLRGESVPSLARTLRRHGYETLALHGNDPTFWNRASAFRALGFQQFIVKPEFPGNAPHDGKYMADRAMTDAIMARLKDSGPPQFVFAISLEAHGPYDIEPADVAARDAIPVPAGIDGKDKRELQTYLYHLRHADAELGRLVAWLATRDRPSRVLFYGDHLPALADVYAKTGFVDGRGMLSQPDTWLLVDPQAGDDPPLRHDTASWLLPATLLAQVGIGDDSYFTLTTLVGDRLAALTAAPGATRVETDATLAELDRQMRSISLMHLSGTLSSILPNPWLPGPVIAGSHAPPRRHPAPPGLLQH